MFFAGERRMRVVYSFWKVLTSKTSTYRVTQVSVDDTVSISRFTGPSLLDSREVFGFSG